MNSFTIDGATALKIVMGAMFAFTLAIPLGLTIASQRIMFRKEHRVPRNKEELEALHREGELERLKEYGLGKVPKFEN